MRKNRKLKDTYYLELLLLKARSVVGIGKARLKSGREVIEVELENDDYLVRRMTPKEWYGKSVKIIVTGKARKLIKSLME